jgi:hypothetical protein
MNTSRNPGPSRLEGANVSSKGAPPMDDFQKRAISNHQSRHREKIRKAAEEIREYAGYILRDLDQGHASSRFAGDVLTDAQTIVTRFAMLEAMGDVTGIIDASED